MSARTLPGRGGGGLRQEAGTYVMIVAIIAHTLHVFPKQIFTVKRVAIALHSSARKPSPKLARSTHVRPASGGDCTHGMGS